MRTKVLSVLLILPLLLLSRSLRASEHEKYALGCQYLLMTHSAFAKPEVLYRDLNRILAMENPGIHEGKLYLMRRLAGVQPRVFEGRPPLAWKKFVLRFRDRAGLWKMPIEAFARVDIRLQFYDYPAPLPGQKIDHVNFADPVLFRFWRTGLFAQDEIQVTEHPVLAAWQNRLLEEEPALVHLEGERQEVALISGVDRLGEIDTRFIYGNEFWNTPEDVLEAFSRPTLQGATNLIAMAARPVSAQQGGRPYLREDIEFHFFTALTGYLAARFEAQGQELVIHTGNWGTGAFGNNPVLIAMLQIFAAHVAHVDQLVYNAGVQMPDAVVARKMVDRYLERPGRKDIKGFLDYVDSIKFSYGTSNGT